MQEVHWVPESRQLPLERRPTRVWTLFLERDPKKAPTLPIAPVVRVNAWPEDVIHDWNHRKGTLRYFSRAVESSVWILVEY
jgi:hypothetical protein